MERKLIKQGGGGLTIYLPKKWVDKKGLKEGENIKITETDTSLIIGSPIKEKKAIAIEINDDNKHDLLHILTHAYRKGYDKITLNGMTPALSKETKNIAKDVLLGFEITETESKSCTLENISEPTDEKFEVILRRVFLIIKETIELILNTENPELFKETEELKKQQDKFVLFCKRILTKEKYDKEIVPNWELLTSLLHIEHTLFYLIKFMNENKIAKDDELKELIKEYNSYFNLLYEGFYKTDLKLIHKVQSLKDKYQYGKLFDLIEKSKGKKAIVYSYLRELFRQTQLTTSPVWLLTEKF